MSESAVSISTTGKPSPLSASAQAAPDASDISRSPLFPPFRRVTLVCSGTHGFVAIIINNLSDFLSFVQ